MWHVGPTCQYRHLSLTLNDMWTLYSSLSLIHATVSSLSNPLLHRRRLPLPRRRRLPLRPAMPSPLPPAALLRSPPSLVALPPSCPSLSHSHYAAATMGRGCLCSPRGGSSPRRGEDPGRPALPMRTRAAPYLDCHDHAVEHLGAAACQQRGVRVTNGGDAMRDQSREAEHKHRKSDNQRWLICRRAASAWGLCPCVGCHS